MKQILLVGLGGFLGSIGRFKLSALLLHQTANWRFPLPTFVVNVLGCLVIGLLAGCAERRGLFSLEARLFLFTGILGGFTTFSAFGLESVSLLRRGEIAIALAYVSLSVCIGLAAVWLGLQCPAFRPPQDPAPTSTPLH